MKFVVTLIKDNKDYCIYITANDAEEAKERSEINYPNCKLIAVETKNDFKKRMSLIEKKEAKVRPSSIYTRSGFLKRVDKKYIYYNKK